MTPSAQLLLDWHHAAIERVGGRAAVRSWLTEHPEIYRSAERPLRLLAIGKAATAMASGAHAVLGPSLQDGLIVDKHQDPCPATVGSCTTILGEHPVPGAGSMAAAAQVEAFATACLPDDMVLVLLSGGASALLADPVPGITPDDLAAGTKALLACGAPIAVINSVRIACSRLKGGGLARLLEPATYLTLAISDVAGDDPAIIGSGPTWLSHPAPDLAVIEAHLGSLAKLPASLLAHLRQPRTTAADPVQSPYHLVARNADAIAAVAAAVRAAGRQPVIAPTFQGPADDVGRLFASQVLELEANQVLLGGGEPVVQLPAKHGRGGRMQQAALAAAAVISGHTVTILAGGTDGTDGPTDANGAWADGATWSTAQQQQLKPADALHGCDAYPLFAGLDQLYRTGPTGTNVTDLMIGCHDARACGHG